jgi:hypothetical protein
LSVKRNEIITQKVFNIHMKITYNEQHFIFYNIMANDPLFKWELRVKMLFRFSNNTKHGIEVKHISNKLLYNYCIYFR